MMPFSLIAVVVRPLPLVAESRFLPRLVVGRVQVVHARFEAGVHDRQILVRQRQVEHDLRLHFSISATTCPTSSASICEMVIGVCAFPLDLLAFGQRSRGEMDSAEDVAVHRTLLAAALPAPPAPMMRTLPIVLPLEQPEFFHAVFAQDHLQLGAAHIEHRLLTARRRAAARRSFTSDRFIEHQVPVRRSVTETDGRRRA